MFFCGGCLKSKDLKIKLTKFLSLHFFLWASFGSQVEPDRCLCGAAGPHSRFFRGRLRIPSSWWSFLFASWTGFWSSFPSIIWGSSTVFPWRRASLIRMLSFILFPRSLWITVMSRFNGEFFFSEWEAFSSAFSSTGFSFFLAFSVARLLKFTGL